MLKEPPRLESSFEYPERMFWLRNSKIIFNYILNAESSGVIKRAVGPRGWPGLLGYPQSENMCM